MKTFFIIAGLLITSLPLFAQNSTVKLAYDAAGNRISRTINMTNKAPATPEELSETTEMAEASYAAEAEELFQTPTFLEEVLAETVVRIYPNPTQGLIKLEILNAPAGEKITLHLFDMSGRKLLSKEGAAYTEIDITSQPEGVYIMLITIGKEQSEWKIIKN